MGLINRTWNIPDTLGTDADEHRLLVWSSAGVLGLSYESIKSIDEIGPVFKTGPILRKQFPTDTGLQPGKGIPGLQHLLETLPGRLTVTDRTDFCEPTEILIHDVEAHENFPVRKTKVASIFPKSAACEALP